MTISKAQLEEWKRLAEEATPGSWLRGIVCPPEMPDGDGACLYCNSDGMGEDYVPGAIHPAKGEYVAASGEHVHTIVNPTDRYVCSLPRVTALIEPVDFGAGAGGTMARAEDAAFIAAAREAVPTLIAEVERLQEELGTKPREMVLMGHDGVVAVAKLTPAGVAVADLRGENDRLRSLLREVEWSGEQEDGIDGDIYEGCPACPICKRGRHTPDCRLAAALKDPA